MVEEEWQGQEEGKRQSERRGGTKYLVQNINSRLIKSRSQNCIQKFDVHTFVDSGAYRAKLFISSYIILKPS